MLRQPIGAKGVCRSPILPNLVHLLETLLSRKCRRGLASVTQGSGGRARPIRVEFFDSRVELTQPDRNRARHMPQGKFQPLAHVDQDGVIPIVQHRIRHFTDTRLTTQF
jgi:hypothetical protein